MAEVYFLPEKTDWQILSVVIREGEKTLLIDGGVSGDAPALKSFLKDLGVDKIDGWFFTHPHCDHIGVFPPIIESGEFKVEGVYFNFPTKKSLEENGRYPEHERAALESFLRVFKGKNAPKVHVIKKGEFFVFGGVKITVLRTYNSKIKNNFANNSSCVYRVETAQKSLLVLGDLGVEGGKELLNECALSDLKTDYTQLAHHGQAGVDEQFYKTIEPRACVWPTPKWLYENDGGGGYDSGPWKTLETRAWMDEIGVKEHVIVQETPQKIEL